MKFSNWLLIYFYSFLFTKGLYKKRYTGTRKNNSIALFFSAEYLRRIEGVRATEVMATKVTIIWEKPSDLTYVEYYEIRLSTGNESQIYQTSNNVSIDYKTIDNLSPGVVYYCKVRVSVRFNGNVRKGDWSFQIYFTTTIPRKKFYLLVFAKTLSS